MKYMVVRRITVETESGKYENITLSGDLPETVANISTENLTIVRSCKEGEAFVIGAVVDLSVCV